MITTIIVLRVFITKYGLPPKAELQTVGNPHTLKTDPRALVHNPIRTSRGQHYHNIRQNKPAAAGSADILSASVRSALQLLALRSIISLCLPALTA
jgi:hypothetical protein